MSFIRRLGPIPITTDSSGDAIGYSPVFTGKISAIEYVKTDYADTVDFVVTNDGTGEAVWSQSNVTASTIVRPRAATHGITGAASLYAAGGTAVQDKIGVAHNRLKIVVDEGGATKTGNFYIVIE